MGLLFIAVGLQAMLNAVLNGDLQRKFVISQKTFHLHSFSFKAMLTQAIFSATCNTTNVALHVAKKNCPSNTPFSQPAMQQNVALQVVGKLKVSSTCHNVARQVAACNMSIATCNTILLKSANQSVSLVMVIAEIYDISGFVASCEQKFRACDIPSATCTVLQSSSLRCKLQKKLPRVTWPLVIS